MLVYVLTYLFAIGFAVISDCFSSGATKKRQYFKGRIACSASKAYGFLALSALSLVLVRGLRCGIGVDYFFTYVPKFEAVASGGEIVDMDAGYRTLMWLCAQLSSDYRVFFLVDSLIFIGIIYAAICLSGQLRGLCVGLFCLGFHFIRSMNIQAQSFAMAISLLGIVLFTFRRKRALGLCVSVVAVAFHVTSAVMLIPMVIAACLFRLDRKAQFRVVIGFGLIFPVCLFACRSVIPTIARAILAGTRFEVYFYSAFADGEFSGYLFAVNWALLLFEVMVIARHGTSLSDPVVLCMLFQAFATAGACLTGAIPLVYRVVYHFMAASIVLLPPLLQLMEPVKAKMGMLAILFCFALVHFAYLSPQDTDRVIPYVSVFDSKETIMRIMEEIKSINGYKEYV